MNVHQVMVGENMSSRELVWLLGSRWLGDLGARAAAVEVARPAARARRRRTLAQDIGDKEMEMHRMHESFRNAIGEIFPIAMFLWTD